MDGEYKSRTRKKNEARELQKLGERLLDLKKDQLDGIDLPDELREALAMGRKTTRHGAKRRQIQYIGKLMRGIDPEPIRNALRNIRYTDPQDRR